MGLFSRPDVKVTTRYQMIVDRGEGFFSWGGNLYKSDIVRAAIRPKARAIGKAQMVHIRKTDGKTLINPEPYMRFLLEEPNPLMSGQMFREKLIAQLELNNNAYAYIQRDEEGYPTGLYPIDATSVECLQDKQGFIYLRFSVAETGQTLVLRYGDVLHLRKDYGPNSVFGTPPGAALTQLMEVINTTDQGIVKAIKNSAVIRWLLQYTTTVRDEDLKKRAEKFSELFLSTEKNGSGVAATDSNAKVEQIKTNEFLPNAVQMDRTAERVFMFFNTNKAIVTSDYTEDQWVSYFEASVEPDLMQLSEEATRKLFTRKERSYGNKIQLAANNLTFASMQTKLGLVQMIDRGAMSPNEVREVLGYAPRDGGDEFVRRLDTRPANE